MLRRIYLALAEIVSEPDNRKTVGVNGGSDDRHFCFPLRLGGSWPSKAVEE